MTAATRKRLWVLAAICFVISLLIPLLAPDLARTAMSPFIISVVIAVALWGTKKRK